ncbi:MAG: hypothetical protein QM811_03630 [Pirellulales bacterium]
MRALLLWFLVCSPGLAIAQESQIAKIPAVFEKSMISIGLYSEEYGYWLPEVQLEGRTTIELELPNKRRFFVRIVRSDGMPLDAGWIDFQKGLRDLETPVVRFRETVVESKIEKGQVYETIVIEKSTKTINVTTKTPVTTKKIVNFTNASTGRQEEREIEVTQDVYTTQEKEVVTPVAKRMRMTAEENVTLKVPGVAVDVAVWKTLDADRDSKSPQREGDLSKP